MILDIDVNGGMNVRRQFGDEAVSIFIAPPSIDELRRRLEQRGSESAEAIEERVGRAAYELGFSDKFDHVVVNDDLKKAIGDIEALIAGFINTSGN